MASPRSRRLALLLPDDLYELLLEAARAEDRDPTQQIRVILRRALKRRRAKRTDPQVPAA